MVNRFIVLISISLLLVSESSSQDFDKIFRDAEEALYREDFETALINYEKLVESGLNYRNRIFYKVELQ